VNDEKKREPKKQLTEAELKAIREARAKAREEDRARANVLEAKVGGMSHRQLRGELNRKIKRDKTKEGYMPGLDLALATVFLTVLDGTKTTQNPSGRLSHYLR